ncbi:MAG: hypothetical protein QRY72_05125 [Candidatus Rhabdochlamydia sp.]
MNQVSDGSCEGFDSVITSTLEKFHHQGDHSTLRVAVVSIGWAEDCTQESVKIAAMQRLLIQERAKDLTALSSVSHERSEREGKPFIAIFYFNLYDLMANNLEF